MSSPHHQVVTITEATLPVPGDQALHGRAIAALEAHKYGNAVKLLEAYLKEIQFSNGQPRTHMALVRAYWGNRQQKDAMALCHHLLNTGEQSTQHWARRFLWAVKAYPKARDPLVAAHKARHSKATLSFDITQQLIVVAVHLSIYGGLIVTPLLPPTFWQDLGQALIQQGTITPELLKPCAIALSPVLLPLSLVYIAQDPVLKAHGKEVMNYWITMLLLLLISTFGGPWIEQGRLFLANIPLLLNLITLGMTLIGLSYGLAPLAAIARLVLQPERFFRYPFILRLL